MIDIRPATFEDARALLQFENENRPFFELWLAERGAAFYQLKMIEKSLKKAEIDRLAGNAFQYLIWQSDDIVGHLSLTEIQRGALNKAHLGFRISQQHLQRGIAAESIEFALYEAFVRLNLWRVEAVVRPDNVGSMRALEKNGFHAFGRSKRSIQLHGHWHDLIHYDRHADGYTPESKLNFLPN